MTESGARARLEARRERHRARTRPRRVLTTSGGGLLGLIALLLVFPALELGLPLLIVALRVLALEFDWAARAYVPVARLGDRVKAVPSRPKLLIAAAALGVVGVIVWWLA